MLHIPRKTELPRSSLRSPRLQSVVTDGAGRTNYSPAITVKVDNEK